MTTEKDSEIIITTNNIIIEKLEGYKKRYSYNKVEGIIKLIENFHLFFDEFNVSIKNTLTENKKKENIKSNSQFFIEKYLTVKNEISSFDCK